MLPLLILITVFLSQHDFFSPKNQSMLIRPMKGKEILTLKAHIFLSVCKLNVVYGCVFLLTMLHTPHDFHKKLLFNHQQIYVDVLLWFGFSNTMLHARYFTHSSVSHFLKLMYLSFYTKISEMDNINEFAIN